LRISALGAYWRDPVTTQNFSPDGENLGGHTAYGADVPEKPIVIIRARDFRLREALRHIEAGRVVHVIPST
jgi:hypothetical protein